MKAIVASPQGAVLSEIEAPQPKPNEILVKVKAASLNRADLASVLAADGKVVGMEWAGEVVGVGSQAAGHRRGDRVMCTGAGGFGEYAVTDWGRAVRVPDGIPYEEATILMLALQTMHHALRTAGRMKKGETVLINGASSGVGLMGLQVAKELGASLVIGTSTTAQRRERLREFGADFAIDTTQEGWVAEVLGATASKGVDVIVDQITGRGFEQTMRTAAVLGRIVNVGRLAGGESTFDFQLHALRRLTYTGVTFRTRSEEEIRELTAAMASELMPAVRQRRLRLPIDRTFPLADAPAAFDRMAKNAHFGKIVLEVAQ